MSSGSDHIAEKERETLDERELIECSKKDPEHFAPLYHKYFPEVYRFVHRRAPSNDEAEDITSQTFLKALSGLRDYEDRGLPFAAWLFRIARNEIRLFYRKRSRSRVVHIEKEKMAGLVGDLLEEEEEALHAKKKEEELLRDAMGAIKELGENEIELLELRYFEMRSFKELAQILGIEENNAKVRNHRILKKLKEQLQKKADHG